MQNHPSRRQFIQQVSTVAAAATVTSRRASAARAPEKLKIALIGCGGRGVHDSELFKRLPGVEIAYVCDVDEARRQAAAKTLGVDDSRAVDDMRMALETNQLPL